jgi:NAD(P)H-dependent FMN reductase
MATPAASPAVILQKGQSMTTTPKILAFAGSTRDGSWNKKLIRVVAKDAEDAGADVTLIDLRDYPMPLYDGDLEDSEGIPERAMALKALFNSHQGLLISSPEYNSGISGVLKNAIDWVSRKAEGEGPLESYKDKVAGLVSASPGALGGLRGLVHLRQILGNIGVLVIPQQMAVGGADKAFDEAGNLTDPARAKAVAAVGTRLTQTLAALAR